MELDSHANMAVIGNNCVVFDQSYGRTCEVEPFDPALGVAKEIPVVDSALAHDCPYNSKTFILILRNALHVKTMDHNLIPPFILRESGVTLNDREKIITMSLQ